MPDAQEFREFRLCAAASRFKNAGKSGRIAQSGSSIGGRNFGHDKLSGVLPDWQSPKSDCRELLTVLAAAELFPKRVLYSSHTRQTIRQENVADLRVRESDPVDGHGPLGVKVLEAPALSMPQGRKKRNDVQRASGRICAAQPSSLQGALTRSLRAKASLRSFWHGCRPLHCEGARNGHIHPAARALGG